MQIFWYHIGFMIAGFSIMFTGMLIARYMKKNRWWLKAHKSIGIIGHIISIIGLGLAIYIVQIVFGKHFNNLHSWVGALTIYFIIGTPQLGLAMLKTRTENKKKIRNLHRIAGRITLSLMFLTMILGIIRYRGIR